MSAALYMRVHRLPVQLTAARHRLARIDAAITDGPTGWRRRYLPKSRATTLARIAVLEAEAIRYRMFDLVQAQTDTGR